MESWDFARKNGYKRWIIWFKFYVIVNENWLRSIDQFHFIKLLNRCILLFNRFYEMNEPQSSRFLWFRTAVLPPHLTQCFRGFFFYIFHIYIFLMARKDTHILGRQYIDADKTWKHQLFDPVKYTGSDKMFKTCESIVSVCLSVMLFAVCVCVVDLMKLIFRGTVRFILLYRQALMRHTI